MLRERRGRMRALVLWAIGLVTLLGAGATLLRAADHRDGPIFVDTAANGRRDINDIYVFRSPANANNTVMIMTVSPFTGVLTPPSFDDACYFDLKVANRQLIDTTDDITFRVSFGPPDATGAQDVLLRGLPASRFPPAGVLARGRAGQNLPVTGGGLFRVANQDDPFFFDAAGFNVLLNGGAFPRPVGTAKDFFGPNANTLAVVLEIPSSVLGAPNALIGIWGRVECNGVQVDRMGRPAINTALIPPIPRGSSFPIGAGGQNRQERRNAFNAGHPRDDRANFKADMVSVLQSFYGRTPADSSAIADLLLPDILVFQLGNPNGFGTFVAGTEGTFLGNGRRLRDDVIDTELNVLTAGAIVTDNVPDDNGTRITDGNMGTTPAFPYIGAPNGTPGGPNP